MYKRITFLHILQEVRGIGKNCNQLMMSCSKTWSSRYLKTASICTMPTPCICCRPYPVLARFSASCCSMTSIVSTAFPSVQALAHTPPHKKSSKESGGKRLGTSGKKIGNAHLTWAFSEAATVFYVTTSGPETLGPLGKKFEYRQSPEHFVALNWATAVLLYAQASRGFQYGDVPPDLGSRADEPGP